MADGGVEFKLLGYLHKPEKTLQDNDERLYSFSFVWRLNGKECQPKHLARYK